MRIFGLEGRVALVTGGTRGIGRAIVEKMESEGAIVHSVSRAQRVDLRYMGDVKKFFGAIDALDILVNNVGGSKKYAPFEDLTDANWRAAFEDNLMTAVRVTRAALPLLKKSAHPAIVNIASMAAHNPSVHTMPYGATKAGLLYLTKSLAEAYRKDGIRVNAVCPSSVRGERWDESIRAKARAEHIEFEEARRIMEENAIAKSSIGSMWTAERVANVVAFLVTDVEGLKMSGECIDLQ